MEKVTPLILRLMYERGFITYPEVEPNPDTNYVSVNKDDYFVGFLSSNVVPLFTEAQWEDCKWTTSGINSFQRYDNQSPYTFVQQIVKSMYPIVGRTVIETFISELKG